MCAHSPHEKFYAKLSDSHAKKRQQNNNNDYYNPDFPRIYGVKTARYVTKSRKRIGSIWKELGERKSPLYFQLLSHSAALLLFFFYFYTCCSSWRVLLPRNFDDSIHKHGVNKFRQFHRVYGGRNQYTGWY